jgi:hypothetical protein
VDVIVDVVGFVPANSPYAPLTPARFADSRNETTFDNAFRNTRPRAAGTVWEIGVAGRGGVPSSAATVVANVTVTGATKNGFATVYPCGTRPATSSLNYGFGITRPNEVIAKLSPSGTICVFTLTDVDVIVDVVGYVGTVPDFTSIVPSRIADSRNATTFDNAFRDTGPRQANSTWEIDVAGRGPVPSDATTVSANLTITNGSGPGFATVYPCGARPTASSLNYTIGTTRPNEVVARLSPTGTLCIYTLTSADVIVDVAGHN